MLNIVMLNVVSPYLSNDKHDSFLKYKEVSMHKFDISFLSPPPHTSFSTMFSQKEP